MPSTEADEEITQGHEPFAVVDASDRLAFAVSRALEGELAEVGRAIEALPPAHPRRRLLLSSLHKIVAMLHDLPSTLAGPSPR